MILSFYNLNKIYNIYKDFTSIHFAILWFTAALLVSDHNLSRFNQYHLVKIWLQTICHSIVIRFNLISQ